MFFRLLSANPTSLAARLMTLFTRCRAAMILFTVGVRGFCGPPLASPIYAVVCECGLECACVGRRRGDLCVGVL